MPLINSTDSTMLRETLAQCEELIGYRFRDVGLLAQALTHSSARAANDPGNERMEFLGDAILGLVISEYLFATLPKRHEGELTRIKSAVVSRAGLAARLQALGLTAFIIIGKGLALKTRIPASVLANVYEAVVAAIYLDGGLEPAKQFCLKSMGNLIEDVQSDTTMRNYKSMLQQLAQRQMNATPQYRITRVRGPEHARSFQVVAIIGDRRFGSAWARTKKDAEQMAASQALTELRPDFPTDAVYTTWSSKAGEVEAGAPGSKSAPAAAPASTVGAEPSEADADAEASHASGGQNGASDEDAADGGAPKAG